MAEWKTLTSKIAYQNPFMQVVEDQTLNPTGKQALYGYCESTEGSAYIVPFDGEGNTYLVEQYRYPHKRKYWEIPAGRIPRNESIEAGAKRELLEETGIKAGTMIRLGEFLSVPGITTFASSVFLAQNLQKTSSQQDAEDGISGLRKVSPDEFDSMVLSGDIQCAGSISAYYMCRTYTERKN